MKLWGIDLGGTKIECAVIDTEETVIRRRIMTEADQGFIEGNAWNYSLYVPPAQS